MQRGVPDTRIANPTLATVLEIQEILRKESQQSALPLSLAEIGRRMGAKKTRHETIRVAVQALEGWGVAALGSKGVIYTKAPAAVVRRKRVAL